MFVELHLIQNFAPSNLNRDDTGAPKDCEFGGYRLARISSQSLKRAMRTAFRNERLLPEASLARRTKRLVDELSRRLAAAGHDQETARAVVTALLAGAKLRVGDDGKTQYLLFLGEQEIDALAALCSEHWDTLMAVSPIADADEESSAGRGRGRARTKRAGQAALPPELARAVERVLDGGRATDLALFGRMLADLPDRNIDAASQVAHALSTNKVSMEFDFYTAVDDLRPQDTAGADMLGTVEFNSACFYRYANVDLEQLKTNLGGDEELTRQTLRAFILASVSAIPTGKQNSMAAQNPPSFIFAVARSRGLWSLANAFLAPIQPARDGDLVEASIAALDQYWGQLTRVYGDAGITSTAAVALAENGLSTLTPARVATVAELVTTIGNAVAFASAGEARS